MAMLGTQTIVTPVTAVNEIKGILTDYILKKNPWHEKAQMQLDAFNAQFPLSHGDLPTRRFTLDEVKGYTLTLAAGFTSMFQWLVLRHGNSSLRQSLEDAANKWPTHEFSLEQQLQSAQAKILAFPNEKTQAIASALAEQKKLSDADQVAALATQEAKHRLALEEQKIALENRMKEEVQRLEARHAEEQATALTAQMEKLKVTSAQETKEHSSKLQEINTALMARLKSTQDELNALKAQAAQFPPLSVPESPTVHQFSAGSSSSGGLLPTPSPNAGKTVRKGDNEAPGAQIEATQATQTPGAGRGKGKKNGKK
jgi:hypothetical protein